MSKNVNNSSNEMNRLKTETNINTTLLLRPRFYACPRVYAEILKVYTFSESLKRIESKILNESFFI